MIFKALKGGCRKYAALGLGTGMLLIWTPFYRFCVLCTRLKWVSPGGDSRLLGKWHSMQSPDNRMAEHPNFLEQVLSECKNSLMKRHGQSVHIRVAFVGVIPPVAFN